MSAGKVCNANSENTEFLIINSSSEAFCCYAIGESISVSESIRSIYLFTDNVIV